ADADGIRSRWRIGVGDVDAVAGRIGARASNVDRSETCTSSHVDDRPAAAGTPAAQNHTAGIDIQSTTDVERAGSEKDCAAKPIGVGSEGCDRVDGSLDGGGVISTRGADVPSYRQIRQADAAAHVAGRRKVHNMVAIDGRRVIDVR